MNGGSARGAVLRAGGRLPRALRAWGTARLGVRADEPCIRFRDAVPARRDRRELRRRFRRAAGAAMDERKTEMAAVLGRLSADHVPLSGVIPGTQGKGKVAVFADGTRLLLGIRCGRSGMERLGRDSSRRPVWLAEVHPCVGCRWFWLGFTPDPRTALLEVLASVAPVTPGSPESWPG